MDNERQPILDSDNTLIKAFDNTSICFFMYYPQTKKITIPEKTCKRYNCKAVYENMPHSFADDLVCFEDSSSFKGMYYLIDEGKKNASTIFHSKDLNYCWRVTLTTITYDENKKPIEVVGIIEDISEMYKSEKLVKEIRNQFVQDATKGNELQEITSLIANSIGSQYYSIFHICMKDHSFMCFQEQLSGVLAVVGTRGDYVIESKKYIENYVEEEDQKAMLEFANFYTIAERLHDTNSIIHIYRRKGLGWTRGQIIAAKRDEKGNVTNIILTATEINNEINREIKQKQALFEAQHDPLTSVYNRNGFDKIINSYKGKNNKVAFALMDIDNFKTLNDSHGHDLGDKVLKEVAELLKSSFRVNDYVFRLGGDEFGVLLTNVEESCWNTFCKKLRNIHHSLSDFLPLNVSASLSVGICFSKEGYNDQLYILADEALYETKRNGRAGCTLIDTNHDFIKKWKDDSLSLHVQSALDYNNTGVYRLEFPHNPNEKPRFICNEMTKAILGVANSTTPEECFKIWSDNIDPSYVDALKETRKIMLEGKHAECTYLWKHPILGKIYVRSGGFGKKLNEMDILFGYHHSLKDTKIVERKDDSYLMISALSDIYFCSYYVDLINDSYSTFKFAPGEALLKMQEKKATETLNNFISVLVHPDYREKMSEFMNLKTLAKRMRGEKYLECEYISLSDKGWCRARFIPIKYNEDGKLTNVLFVIATLDSYKAQEIEENLSNKKSLEALYNNVPGGIIMYEWDGKNLKTLHISEYYAKQYGYSLISGTGGPDFMRLHPDDVEDYKKAILKGLTETHKLEYVYRVWNNSLKRYVWVKLNAVAEDQGDGTSLVYAMYSDVTEQKDAEQRLEKNKASLSAALTASNQLCYEYDPIEHVGECYASENYFNLPKRIDNYPESLREYDLFHPEDIDKFINTAHEIDHGQKASHCNVRIKKGEEYRWFSCTFNAYYDLEKERNVAILTVVDISMRIEAMKDYENRIQSLMGINEESLSAISFDLTKNTYEIIKYNKETNYFSDGSKTFEQLMNNVSKNIVGKDDQEEYRNTFSKKNLLECASKGQMQVKMDILLKISNNHTEWLETSVELVKNPATGSIGGVCYSKSIQTLRMSTLLLKKTLQQDYPMTAIIYIETDEYYLFDSRLGNYGSCKKEFWKSIGAALAPISLNSTSEELQKQFSKEKVLAILKESQEYSFPFDSEFGGQRCRLEIKFSYLDNTHNLILASLRNITDSILLDKLRHDTSHDLLTELYNRKKVFQKCREIIENNPNEQYAMLHFDIKHFHLYNTFFGDEAGDKLLCDIADILREIDKQHDICTYGRLEADVFCLFSPYNKAQYEKDLQVILNRLKSYRDDFIVEPTIGVYLVDDNSMPIEAMFTRATIAAKGNNSTNLVTYYNENMEHRLADEQRIVSEMQTAIEQEQFKIYIQPKYALRTNNPVGGEALVRWIHPQRGMIPPSEFIPVFERNGFIATLDKYIWEHVCQLLNKWEKEGKEIAPVSVNVSRISMYSPSTVQFLKDLVKKYNVNPKYLELELTETAYMDDPYEMKHQLYELQKYGFKILMDDFGSGYSSLNTLKELPVDCLKLDMKFLSNSNDDRRGKMILSSIIRMSKLLDLYVIAEGVETEEQAEFLRSIGCEYVQGYLYAKPMPVEEYERILLVEDIPDVKKNPKEIDKLSRMLTDTSSLSYGLVEFAPIPTALIEFSEDHCVFIWVNKAFIDEFEMNEDYTPASKQFAAHLGKENYNKLLDSYSLCANSKENTSIQFNWNKENQPLQKYCGKASYEGKIGQYSIMLVVFMNITYYK